MKNNLKTITANVHPATEKALLKLAEVRELTIGELLDRITAEQLKCKPKTAHAASMLVMEKMIEMIEPLEDDQAEEAGYQVLQMMIGTSAMNRFLKERGLASFQIQH